MARLARQCRGIAKFVDVMWKRDSLVRFFVVRELERRCPIFCTRARMPDVGEIWNESGVAYHGGTWRVPNPDISPN